MISCAEYNLQESLFTQLLNRLDIPVGPHAHYRPLCIIGHIGNLPEGLPGFYIGNVNLHGGNHYRLQRVQDGDAGVGVGTGVDDDAVNILEVCLLNPVYQALCHREFTVTEGSPEAVIEKIVEDFYENTGH